MRLVFGAPKNKKIIAEGNRNDAFDYAFPKSNIKQPFRDEMLSFIAQTIQTGQLIT